MAFCNICWLQSCRGTVHLDWPKDMTRVWLVQVALTGISEKHQFRPPIFVYPGNRCKLSDAMKAQTTNLYFQERCPYGGAIFSLLYCLRRSHTNLRAQTRRTTVLAILRLQAYRQIQHSIEYPKLIVGKTLGKPRGPNPAGCASR